ncbi:MULTISPECIES: hypothetical protein [Rufibacter]|uniref:Uncharacterized protein n=1 Tax=Rufibacter quisquiliarum TaxID=1549639 RepID=A0A839GG28_9BACT|nr:MULTISPECIES: hypothetical protein [Rufibacter]MBA9078614.1 hypothetical protein [Rufibacter quisquiliarum]
MPIEKDNITNAKDSQRLPEENPTPNQGNQSEAEEIAKPDRGGSGTQAIEADYLDAVPEGSHAEGNIAADNEEDAWKLDGSNANNLRTK